MADTYHEFSGDQPAAKFALASPQTEPMQGSLEPADLSGLSTINLDDPVVPSLVPPATMNPHAGYHHQHTPQQQQQTGGSANTPTAMRATATAEVPEAATAQPEAAIEASVVGVSSIGDSGDIDAIADPAAVRPPHAKNLPIKVWVKDPEKREVSRVGVTFHSYVTYLLRTECSSHIYPDAAKASAGCKGDAHVFEVRRRFADFEMLHRLLRSHYRGYFLPPLPDKAFLESRFAGDSFLKVRKVDLQAYMCTIANHPTLQGSEVLQLFLTQPGELNSCTRWQQLIQRPAPADILLGLLNQNRQQRSQTAAASVDGSNGIAGAGANSTTPLGMVMRMKHSLKNAVQPKVIRDLPADEQQLRQAKDWCKELHQHLSQCVAVVRSFVSHLESLADDLNDLGRSFSHMARYEEQLAQRQGQYTASGSSSTQRAADLQLIGYAALRQQAVEKQFALRSGASLVFLHDWWVLVPEVVACLEEREDALEAVQMLEEELRDKQAAAARAASALGPVAAPDKRLAVLNANIHTLTEKWAAAKEQYELYKERNQSELVRLNLQRAVDFRESLQRLASVQLQLAQAAAEVWQNAVQHFNASQ